ncbi:MAG: DUF4402 domain-containing protein [Bacteroidales bacterium]
MKKILFLSAILLALTVSSFGQVTETAAASATIVSPISLAHAADMYFGNVAVDGTAGTVILAPDGTRTPVGGVTLPATTGTVTAASFTVGGTNSYTYVITLPGSITISDGATATMTVDNFTSDPSGTGTLSGTGTQILNVGATLNVDGNQTPGNYTNAAFDVTVNYN